MDEDLDDAGDTNSDEEDVYDYDAITPRQLRKRMAFLVSYVSSGGVIGY